MTGDDGHSASDRTRGSIRAGPSVEGERTDGLEAHCDFVEVGT